MEHALLSQKQDYLLKFPTIPGSFPVKCPIKVCSTAFTSQPEFLEFLGIKWKAPDVSGLFPSISPASVTTNQVRNSSNHLQTRVAHTWYVRVMCVVPHSLRRTLAVWLFISQVTDRFLKQAGLNGREMWLSSVPYQKRTVHNRGRTFNEM